jgi:hypothetical protein
MKQLGWTTFEQSKKLVEAGLDPNTADMSVFEAEGKQYVYAHKPDDINCTPCWSLGALVTLMPADLLTDKYCMFSGFQLTKLPNYYLADIMKNRDSQTDSHIEFKHGESAINVVVDLMLWLLENGYIKKEETK